MSLNKFATVFFTNVLIFQFVVSFPYYTAITSRLDETVLLYPGQARSDRDLDVCTSGGICSVVHQRFWFPQQTEKLCRCQNDEECPFRWTDHTDNRTLFLNNRSQMKTCNRTNTMTVCKPDQTALTVDEMITESLKERKIKATVFCNCESPAYWNHQRNYYKVHTNGTKQTIIHFSCAKLTKCKVGQECGHVRSDYYSTYQHCSCPKGHLCLTKDKQEFDVKTELLMNVPAYKAYCMPFKMTEATTTMNDELTTHDKLNLQNNTISVE